MPSAEIERVPQCGCPGSEVVAVALGVGRVELVVARRRKNLRVLASPVRVVVGPILAQRPIRIGVVPQEQNGVGVQGVEQARRRRTVGRGRADITGCCDHGVARRGAERDEPSGHHAAHEQGGDAQSDCRRENDPAPPPPAQPRRRGGRRRRNPLAAAPVRRAARGRPWRTQELLPRDALLFGRRDEDQLGAGWEPVQRVARSGNMCRGAA